MIGCLIDQTNNFQFNHQFNPYKIKNFKISKNNKNKGKVNK